jgi:hypothetical protein
MGVVEWFQGLAFGEKIGIATLAVATIGVFLQLRSYRLDRAEQRRAGRHDVQDRRAALVLERPRSHNRGAEISLGTVVHKGPMAGQHFSASIRNTGPYMAENIRVAASFGTLDAEIDSAPTTLPPHSPAEPIDLRVPFGKVAYHDIAEQISAGAVLGVRIDFTDGTSSPTPLEQCFVFRLDHIEGVGDDWTSHLVPCPASFP